MNTVLVIEDDELIRENVMELLEAEGFQGVGAADGRSGVAAALSDPPDVVVCDILMPVMNGHDVLRALRSYPETATIPFIFLTARAQRAEVREGMRLGAEDYLTKPFTRDELLESIRARLERRRVLAGPAGAGWSGRAPRMSGMIVRSPAMEALMSTASRAASSDLCILIQGETGVGKDLVAHAIHKASPRAPAPFFPLNCAAIPEALVESELFGHEKGAFTNASHDKSGIFESASGGTVFLDEVGELSLALQAKLLRVIEDRRVLPVGARAFRDVNVRFIAATNRDLEVEIRRGTFREDLSFRLGALSLTVPPLRERREDLAPLAERFLEESSRHLGRTAPLTLSAEAFALLERYRWPGNVRELKNAIERAVTLADGPEVRPEHLPERIRSGEYTTAANLGDEKERLLEEIGDLERKRTLEALAACGGNQTRAAAQLGISRRTLLYRLDAYQVARPRKRR